MYKLHTIKKNILIASFTALLVGCGGGSTSSTPSASSASSASSTSSTSQVIESGDTVTGQGLENTEVRTVSSKYLEAINLPKCDASNPEVQFIRSNADWNTINSSSKRIFCVSPGDYRSLGNIKLTANGTAAKRRYIILNNGNDLHPGKLNTGDLANYGLNISGGYWTIDRLSSISPSIYSAIEFSGANAVYNVINRAFANNYTRAVVVGNNSNNNTIQKCRFQNMLPAAMNNDVVAINILAWGIDSFTIKNTKILNNEIVTSNDGIQITRSPKDSDPGGDYQEGNAEGTIIDGNHIYQDPTQMGGALGENAIDIKVGSDNPSNPILITNNIMWEWTIETTDDGDGTTIVLHYSPKNVKIYNNVFFDSGISVTTGGNGPVSGFPYGMLDGEIANNLVYNMSSTAIIAGATIGTDIHDNTFINCTGIKAQLAYNVGGSYFRDNILVNPIYEYDIHDNDSAFTSEMNTNIEYTDTSTAGYAKDYLFTTDQYTNRSRVITLYNALKY